MELLQQIEDFIIDNIDTAMDLFSISFLASLSLQKWCKFNAHQVFGDLVYYVGGALTLAWLVFRALSSIEDYRMKKNARKFQNEVIDEANRK